MKAIHHVHFEPFAIAIMGAGPLKDHAHVVTSIDDAGVSSSDYIVSVFKTRVEFGRALRRMRSMASGHTPTWNMAYVHEWLRAASYALVALC